MSSPATIRDWLGAVAAIRGTAVALAGVEGPDLTYNRLVEQVDVIGGQLREHGVRSGDVILIAVRDGPEALLAILAAASVATAFPVGATDQPERYERLFEEVPIRAVVCEERLHASLHAATAARGIVLLTLTFDPADAAGIFRLASTPEASSADRPGESIERPALGDAALLIATSGSTAASKIVSVSHASLFASVTQFSEALSLSADDRSLCVMPMSHLHSLLRSILPGLISGGSVVCTPGFSQRDVLGWIDKLRPTYLTGAPSIYRHLLRLAGESQWNGRHGSLRLLVVGSDVIDPATLDGIQATFGVPLFQFYVLSETAPVIAMTRRDDPGNGSVMHVSPPWSVVCVDENGTPQPPGTEGEIAVIGGFINPLVSGGAPIDQRLTPEGRLLTGDLGIVDADGVLSLTGRIDDRIQRGGEKISPRAVEEVLLQHPDVERAAVYGFPDPVLGQRVAAAVVLVAGGKASASDLQTFLAARLSGYMVPEKLALVAELPTNHVGKVVPRSRLAAVLDPGDAAVPTAPPAIPEKDKETHPGDDTSSILSNLFRKRLNVTDLDPAVSFFDLGGDSFGAIELLIEIEDRFGVRIPPAIFAGHSSVSLLAEFLKKSAGRPMTTRIAAVRSEGRLPPLFVPYALGGSVGYGTSIANALGPDQPLYTLHTLTGTNDAAPPDTIEQQAAPLVEAIRSIQPEGPYHLLGYSFGAHIALEIAQQLHELKQTVAFLGLVDDGADLDRRHFGTEQERHLTLTTWTRNEWALRRYVPKPYPGHVTLFRATEPADLYQSDPFAGWGDLALGGIEVHDVAGDHTSLVTGKGLTWAFQLNICLAKARHRTITLAEASKASRGPRGKGANNASHHTTNARIAAKLGDRKTEIKEYRKAIQIDAAQPLWVQRNLGLALLEDGSIEPGIAQLQRAIAADPWPIKAMVQLAEMMLTPRRPEIIAALYNQARELVADDPDTLRNWGHLCRLAGKFDESEAAIRRAIVLEERKTYKDNFLPDLHGYLSDLLAHLGRIGEALDAANEALKLKPGNQKYTRRVAQLLERARRPFKAG